MANTAVGTDLYARLGVTERATPDEIVVAFRARAKALHPDLHPGDAAVAESFKALTAAYGVLGDPDARAAYDRRRDAHRRSDGANGAARPPTTGHHAPVFRTPRAARAALWSGVGLLLAGVVAGMALAMVDTGGAPKTITLWLVAVKLVVCGALLWGVGWWRLHRLRLASPLGATAR